MSTHPHEPSPTLARACAKAATRVALTAALLLAALPVRADIDFATAERIALEHIPGQIENVQRAYGMIRVGVRAANGVKYELSIDIARGTVQRVRPAG